MSIHDNEKSKIYPDLNPTASQKPQAFFLKYLTEIEVIYLMKLNFVKDWQKKKKKKKNKCNHKHRYFKINS